MSNETAPPEISFVIPCHNEQDNLRALVAAIREAAGPLKRTYEIVITDDSSTDNSWKVLKELAADDTRVRGLRFAFNCGQSAALWAGMNAACGRYIITLDADLQNDPRDVPQFLQALEKFDCVCGSRIAARGAGDGFVPIASSRIANWVRNKLSGENVTDAGCCYRARRHHLPSRNRHMHLRPSQTQHPQDSAFRRGSNASGTRERQTAAPEISRTATGLNLSGLI